MSGKGFGQSQPTKIDKIVESAVRCCHKRQPEALDQIFDNLPVKGLPKNKSFQKKTRDRIFKE